MKRLFGLLWLLAWMPSAHSIDWVVDQGSSRLGFTAEFEGIPFDGVYADWNASIRFDPAAASGRFDVRVQPGSVDSNMTERDDALRMDAWFAVARFPEARFQAERFQRVDDGFVADGTLTLKGISAPVSVEFSWTDTGSGVHMTGSADLQRLTFKVGEGEDFAGNDVVGHAVKVWFELVLRQ